MFFKLSFRNIRRSIKDYTVYFLTLMLAVSIFYMFNSMEAQQAMLDISAAHATIFQSLSLVMNIVSFFVAAVLAFLVIYANKFMIKRRKKEFGIYMTLGMPQGRISRMLVLETLLIGALALAAGLGLGILASQGLAVITANMFQVAIVNYHFVFSPSAMNATLIGFGVIFIVVVLFNARSISRLKLIALLTDARKNEELKLRKKSSTFVFFIIGVVLTAISYYFVITAGVTNIVYTLGPGLALNTAGSLFLFASISGFMLEVAQKNKAGYFKGLTAFTMRQMNSKVNSNFVSMAFICEMLFLTIVILSTITSMNSATNENLYKFAPYDVSFTLHTSENPNGDTAGGLLPAFGIDENTLFEAYYEYATHGSGLTVGDIARVQAGGGRPQEMIDQTNQAEIEAISLSDFNALMALQGAPPLALSENEHGVLASQSEIIQDSLTAFKQNPHPISVGGHELHLGPNAVRDEGIWTSRVGFNNFMLIVPGNVADNLPQSLDIYVANYAGDSKSVENTIYELDRAQNPDSAFPAAMFTSSDGAQLRYATKDEVVAGNSGVTTMLIFVGIYMGLIFLIAAAAVLALQQLTEASDSKRRFDLLRQIGAGERMISRALFRQVGSYFLLPLVLAAIHSVVGIYVVNSGINIIAGLDVLQSAGLTAILMAIVYGGYFLATYVGCRGIIRAKPGRVD
ncbi:MAG TPA: ABC transporter permease [Clostridiales bacterium]|nr:ABC transporter permease [Clostridiales bacterium]